MTTTAARQLLRGRSPSRGEWEHTPCSLFGERIRCAARVKNLSKKKKKRRLDVSCVLGWEASKFATAVREAYP
jgi:hypothetical protein